MKPMSIVGIVLLALGIAALAFQGFTYTGRGKTVDIGPLQVTTERTRRVPLPPIFGAIAVVGGIALLVVDRQRLGQVVTR